MALGILALGIMTLGILSGHVAGFFQIKIRFFKTMRNFPTSWSKNRSQKIKIASKQKAGE